MNLVRSLRRRGVLGINQRNATFMLPFNSRCFYPRVDDKLETKRICERLAIPTPRVLATAHVHGESKAFVGGLSELSGFALKPAHGAMGNGIMVVRQTTKTGFVTAGGREVSFDQAFHHVSSILSGLFSLGGQTDVAFAEELLEVHPELRKISADGVPDVRIIVFRSIPVMAMTRLPSRHSRGRANLHQGAVGAGIDLSSGRTNFAVIRSTPVQRHPDTNEAVVDRPIPGFERALEIALRASDAAELGFVGADVVVDAKRGPLILELNARPGLAIQVANRAGLLPRLRAVQTRLRPGLSVAERIALGKEVAAA